MLFKTHGDKQLKIAIASGKGGTGKTFVATNLYSVLQQNQVSSILIDCDAEEPNDHFFFKSISKTDKEVQVNIPVISAESCIFCDKCYEYCHYNAIFYLPSLQQIHVMEDLCHSCGACSVACEHNAITEKKKTIGTVTAYLLSGNYKLIESRVNIGVYSPVPVITSAIKEAEQQGIIILDAPPGTSCPFIHTVNNADYVVLVAEPTPFGLSDLQKTIAVLHILEKPFGIVINKSDIGTLAMSDFIQKENYDLLLSIPFDRSVASFYSEGKIMAVREEKWKEIFENLIDKIIETACK